MDKAYYVYIMSNKTNTTIYIGVTNNLTKRVYQHKNPVNKRSFTGRYNVNKLVYYEYYNDVKYAISREKQLKGWLRSRKNKLITDFNENWDDLYDKIIGV